MKRKLSILFLIALISTSSANIFALELYKANVVASFYGEDFHGKRTSSGENFDMNDYTCAHKELPFDTILKVTNLANGNTCEVRVNDRGPFVVTREIDLSKAAAIKLDMIGTGTANVKLEIVKRGPDTKLSLDTANSAKKIMEKKTGSSSSGSKTSANSSSTAKSAPKTSEKSSAGKSSAATNVVPGKIWDIQVASFKEKENATIFARNLKGNGFENIVFQSNSEIVRVVLSKVPSEDVETITKKLEENGYFDFVIRERRK